ncbi:MAG: hypothetical protein PHX91_00835 [Prevotella sp.]|nr:hypothetical protein [Prevotella sp.]
MKYFTLEDVRPSETTLHIIRQIAYKYRTIAGGEEVLPLCLN